MKLTTPEDKVMDLAKTLAHEVDKEFGSHGGETALYFSILYMIQTNSPNFKFNTGLKTDDS